jgi:peptide/nickel transport system permease protein
MGVLVLAISVPIGFIVGVLAGYYRDTWIETVLMRIVDIFLSVPALVLALAIASIMEPNLRNSMIAITIMWWPWYARLTFGVVSSLRTENYITYAELTGAGLGHIIVKEFLPNTIDQILTKMTLDIGYVIIMGATLSFAGLGEQPPIPALGNMINDGVKFLPDMWWLTIFPAVTIILIVLGFNLVGDGVGNIFNVEGN